MRNNDKYTKHLITKNLLHITKLSATLGDGVSETNNHSMNGHDPVLEIFENSRDAVRYFDSSNDVIQYFEHGYPCDLVQWHYHTEYELHLIVEGVGHTFVGDHAGRFKAGQLFLIGPCLPHNWVSDCAPGDYISLRDRVVHFDHGVIDKITDTIPELSNIRPILKSARHGIQFLDGDKWAEPYMLNIRDSTGAARFGHFCAFLNELSHRKSILLSSDKIHAEKMQTYNKKLQIAVDYVHKHSSQKIYLREIASHIGMGENYFSQFFQQSTGGCRFTDFVNGIRINKACDLLTTTNLQISEVCFEVGFNSLTNFSRRFRLEKQLTPSEYRRLSRRREFSG